jgi:S-adenosylmethionine:tRNA ribosyltransferase-isomerase
MNTGRHRGFKRERLYFNLPIKLIAQKKDKPQRLLVLFRKNNKFFHCEFKDLLNFLNPADLLVFNDSMVIPTRIWGIGNKGGQLEITLVNRIDNQIWEALVRPNEEISKAIFLRIT